MRQCRTMYGRLFRLHNRTAMCPIPFFQRSILAIPLIALLASCQKQDESAPVTELALRHELTFSIPPGDQTDLDLTTVYDARASVSALLQEKGFSPDQLRDVRIESARAVMIEPVNVPFHTLNTVRLDFTLPAGTPLNFAHLDPVPNDRSILDLSVDHADLTPFFEGDPQTVHARLKMTGPDGSDTTRVRFALTFRVKAGD